MSRCSCLSPSLLVEKKKLLVFLFAEERKMLALPPPRNTEDALSVRTPQCLPSIKSALGHKNSSEKKDSPRALHSCFHLFFGLPFSAKALYGETKTADIRSLI